MTVRLPPLRATESYLGECGKETLGNAIAPAARSSADQHPTRSASSLVIQLGLMLVGLLWANRNVFPLTPGPLAGPGPGQPLRPGAEASGG